MNERINELAEQATTIEYGADRGFFLLLDKELFAELIVQECAEIAYNKQYKHSAAHTRGDCAEAIKQHFGVEL